MICEAVDSRLKKSHANCVTPSACSSAAFTPSFVKIESESCSGGDSEQDGHDDSSTSTGFDAEDVQLGVFPQSWLPKHLACISQKQAAKIRKLSIPNGAEDNLSARIV